jgi:Co/Zn/Cd efflux system component
MEKIEKLVMAFSVMCAFEFIMGIITRHFPMFIDCLMTLMLIGTIYFSYKALDMSNQGADSTYTLGYKRLDLLAAYCNCIYLQCMKLFDLLETFHHLIEHWELESQQVETQKSGPQSEPKPSPLDEPNHLKEV